METFFGMVHEAWLTDHEGTNSRQNYKKVDQKGFASHSVGFMRFMDVANQIRSDQDGDNVGDDPNERVDDVGGQKRDHHHCNYGILNRII